MSGWENTAPMLPDHDLDPPDYGDYEQDEDYLDNVEEGEDKPFGTPGDDIEDLYSDKFIDHDRR